MLALFLSQILVDALQDLVDHPNQDPVTLLVELKTEEDDLMERFLKADFPEAASKIYYTKKTEIQISFTMIVSDLVAVYVPELLWLFWEIIRL
jgi:hypothetical protein